MVKWVTCKAVRLVVPVDFIADDLKKTMRKGKSFSLFLGCIRSSLGMTFEVEKKKWAPINQRC